METIGLRPEWYALNVRERHEHVVAEYLSQLGQEQFFPLRKTFRNDAGEEHSRGQALFPGYLFCRIDWKSGPKLYNVPGIIKVVGAGRTPIPIPDTEIEAVRKVVESGVAVECVSFVVKPSSMVVIKDGPLQGIQGIVISERNTQSLIVSVPLLRRSLSVVLDRSWLNPCHA